MISYKAERFLLENSFNFCMLVCSYDLCSFLLGNERFGEIVTCELVFRGLLIYVSMYVNRDVV